MIFCPIDLVQEQSREYRARPAPLCTRRLAFGSSKTPEGTACKSSPTFGADSIADRKILSKNDADVVFTR
jgi:hypothetical protein